MAIFSTHLLSSIDGSHASNVNIEIYKIDKNNYKSLFLKECTDENGRLLKELKLSKEDCESDFEMLIDIGDYFKSDNIINFISIKFKMKESEKKYHIPLIISPNGYSVWWSK
mgnify:CR=1 FL=1|tara:strand:- start:186 stop:521 length:336 start_codon:yes stop_codon:yes gene_type:complete